VNGTNKNNKREGKGVRIWGNGSMYEGCWKNDCANGKGRFISHQGAYVPSQISIIRTPTQNPKSAVYEGDWKDDKAEGYGVYEHLDGTRYVGQWKMDKQHGQGEEVYPDGSRYKGEYVEGVK
jgi:hypothetical protein